MLRALRFNGGTGGGFVLRDGGGGGGGFFVVIDPSLPVVDQLADLEGSDVVGESDKSLWSSPKTPLLLSCRLDTRRLLLAVMI